MGVFEAARLRAGATLREWREKRAERKALKEQTQAANQLHGHSRFWLLNVPAIATICAAIVEWYWALLFCIEATGHVDWNFETGFGSSQPTLSQWNFAFEAHLPVLLGLIAATAPIVMISMIWLPVQFAMRGFGRWRRGTMIAVGVMANVLVIVSGTVVMNYNRQDQVRDALVVEQSAEAQRGVLTANVAALESELATLMNHRSTYIATASSVGAEEYERGYVAQARATNDPRLPLLERALGAARRADTLRAEIRQARVTAASAAPAAASVANVQDTVGAGLNTFAQQVEVWRPPFIAVLCTLIGIFGAWWTLAMLEHMNPKDVLRSGWAPEELRIEDLRAEEPIVPQPMKPAREVVTDADTGEEMVKVKPREYWRKRKGQKQRLAIEPEVPPDERGVEYDGGGRIGSSVGPVDVGAILAQGAGDNAQAVTDAEKPDTDADKTEADAQSDHQENEPIQPTPPKPEPEIDFDALIEPESQQTEPKADEPQPDEAVEQDNAERDDVEPRGLLPAA